jgi:hypothetical protein
MLNFQALTMDEIMATGKILRSHCQPKTGVTDGKYQSSWAEVPKCFMRKSQQNDIHHHLGKLMNLRP